MQEEEEYDVIWIDGIEDVGIGDDDVSTAEDFYRTFPRYLVLGEPVTLSNLETLGFTVWDEGDNFFTITNDNGGGFVMEAANGFYLKSIIIRRCSLDAMKCALRIIFERYRINLIEEDSEFWHNYTSKKKNIIIECKKFRNEMT